VALVVTVLLTLYMARAIARPLRDLAATAERVRPGYGRVDIQDLSGRNDEIGDLSSADFGAPGDVKIGDKHYQLIEVSDIARQSRAKLEISSLPQATFWDRTQATASDIPYELAAPALLGLLMVSLIAIAVARRGGLFGGLASGSGASEESGDRATIVEQIADLERALDEGKIREADYFAKRQALLDRLATLPLSPSTD